MAYTINRVRVRCSSASYHHLVFKVSWELTAARSGILLEGSVEWRTLAGWYVSLASVVSWTYRRLLVFSVLICGSDSFRSDNHGRSPVVSCMDCLLADLEGA